MPAATQPSPGAVPPSCSPPAPAAAAPVADQVDGLLHAPDLIARYPLVAALAAGQVFNRFRFWLQQAFFFHGHDARVREVADGLRRAAVASLPLNRRAGFETTLGGRLQPLLDYLSSPGHLDEHEHAESDLNGVGVPTDQVDDLPAFRGELLARRFDALAAVRDVILAELDPEAATAFRLGEAIDRAAAPADVYRDLDDDMATAAEMPPGDFWSIVVPASPPARRRLATRPRAPGEAVVRPGWRADVESLWRELSLPPGDFQVAVGGASHAAADVCRRVALVMSAGCAALGQRAREREPARRLEDRLRVQDVGAMTIWFDGVVYPVEHRPAFTLLRRLIEAGGEVVATTELRKVPGCAGRPDRVIKRLPEELTRLVRGIPGEGGYHLRLPAEKP